jgi:hypothetical protein
MPRERDSLNRKLVKYELQWPPLLDPVELELFMCRKGGQWIATDGKPVGNGLFFHFKAGIQALWPSIKWWHGCDKFLEGYLGYRTMAVLGPSSIGKTDMAAFVVLWDYYCFSGKTKVIVTSTTAERMRDRIWGRMVQYHIAARKTHPSLPGHVVGGRMRILTNPRTDNDNPEDCGTGIVGVPSKKGENSAGLADFTGFKADRIRLLGDEIQFLPMAFVTAISNLDKNPRGHCHHSHRSRHAHQSRLRRDNHDSASDRLCHRSYGRPRTHQSAGP